MFTRLHAEVAKLRLSPPPAPLPKPPTPPVLTAAEFAERHERRSPPHLEFSADGWCLRSPAVVIRAGTNAPQGLSVLLSADVERPLGTIGAMIEWLNEDGIPRWTDADRVVAWLTCRSADIPLSKRPYG